MKSGRRQEFESATMPHVNALFQTALQLTEDRAAAEDLIHEACTYAWKSFGRRDGLADWRSTLFKILLQRARRSANTTEASPAILSGIPRALREIILLVDCQDFSYQQAADILGCSRDEIVEGVIRGRTQLETTLRNYCEVRQ